MAVLADVTLEEALHITRDVERSQELAAGIMTPMAGTQLVKLDNLAAAESFLVSVTGETALPVGSKVKINHVDPRMLASWVRDVIGDVELGNALGEIAATGKTYGLLVPELKKAIAERLEQCNQVLNLDGDSETETEGE